MFQNAFQMAVDRFHQYLQDYDLQDPKIQLKVVHTFGVVRAASYLSEALGLSEEDDYLCRIIALLHDIGRFEQLRRYNSFDDSIMPHAQCSIDILFTNAFIREFVPSPQWDRIIYEAIQFHGIFRMPEIEDPRCRMHAALIRDADKLDNFRVKSTDSVLAMVDVSPEELGAEPITPAILACFLNNHPILNSDRVTHMDMWLSYLGYIYDLNFSKSFLYVLENRYIDQIIDRIPYSNPATAASMEQIRSHATAYCEKRRNLPDYANF